MELTPVRIGAADVRPALDGWRLLRRSGANYADAQLDDTTGVGRRAFAHRPPVVLSLEARASRPAPPGTLGFGFWNDPFPSFGGQAGASRRLPASPQAAWFFHASPPSQLAFDRRGGGSGWRAACLRTPRLPAALAAASGALAFAGLAVPPARRLVLDLAWRTIDGAQSDEVPGLDDWRAYRIEWDPGGTAFAVDGVTVLETRWAPAGPLGLVIWIDNQWASLTEQSGLRFGVVPAETADWLEIRRTTLNGIPLRAAGIPSDTGEGM